MPAVPTYAAENLWNFQLKDNQLPMDDPENIELMASFTGLETEAWFYKIPTIIEARGGPLILQALEAIEVVNIGDPLQTTKLLQEMGKRIDSLTELLPRKCDPGTFYNQVRPFLSGTMSAEVPDGILYEGLDGLCVAKKLKGPTAAQSSLFQFLDIVLGDHRPTGEPALQNSHSTDPTRKEQFLEVSSRYASRRLR